MVDPGQLQSNTCYFHLNYFDRALSVPDIKTLYFVAESVDKSGKKTWIFQDAEHFHSTRAQSGGHIVLSTLAALFDWSGLVSELTRNLDAQRSGVPFN